MTFCSLPLTQCSMLILVYLWTLAFPSSSFVALLFLLSSSVYPPPFSTRLDDCFQDYGQPVELATLHEIWRMWRGLRRATDTIITSYFNRENRFKEFKNTFNFVGLRTFIGERHGHLAMGDWVYRMRPECQFCLEDGLTLETGSLTHKEMIEIAGDCVFIDVEDFLAEMEGHRTVRPSGKDIWNVCQRLKLKAYKMKNRDFLLLLI